MLGWLPLDHARSFTLASVGVIAATVLCAAGIQAAQGRPASAVKGGPVATAMAGHTYNAPECTPLHGRRWVYPGPTALSSTLYESFAISYPCTEAATWTKRLIGQGVAFGKNDLPVKLKGPKGYLCEAYADATKHAYAGACQKGKRAFGWNWNVANPHDFFAKGANGKPMLVKGGGDDADTLLRSLAPNRYELDITNSSGIGFINRFTWSPPAALKITGIKHVSGAKCSLVDGKLSCTGLVRPPACLCDGSGGNVVIQFTTAAAGGTGTSGAQLDLTKMTSVPFLIPGTPQAEARQKHGE